MNAEQNQDSLVQRLDIVQAKLNRLHGVMGLVWREIAALEDYSGIPAGTLCAISKGREPKKPKHRAILKLPPLTADAPVCTNPECEGFGQPHTYDCREQVVKPKPRKRQPRPSVPYFKCRQDDIEQVRRQVEKYLPGYELKRKGE